MDMSVTEPAAPRPPPMDAAGGRGGPARPQQQRPRCLAREGRRTGRAQAHHGGSRSATSRPPPSPTWSACRRAPPCCSRTSRTIPGTGALQHDRLQPVALLPDDRREAGRSSARGGADPAAEDGAQAGAASRCRRSGRSATRTSSPAMRSTSACSRRNACGRSTAAKISAPPTRW